MPSTASSSTSISSRTAGSSAQGEETPAMGSPLIVSTCPSVDPPRSIPLAHPAAAQFPPLHPVSDVVDLFQFEVSFDDGVQHHVAAHGQLHVFGDVVLGGDGAVEPSDDGLLSE